MCEIQPDTIVQHLANKEIVTICCICNRVLNDNDTWESADPGVATDNSCALSHAFCPECVKVHYPFVFDYK